MWGTLSGHFPHILHNTSGLVLMPVFLWWYSLVGRSCWHNSCTAAIVFEGPVFHSFSQSKQLLLKWSSSHLIFNNFPCHFSLVISCPSCCCWALFAQTPICFPLASLLSAVRHVGLSSLSFKSRSSSLAYMIASLSNEWCPDSAALSSNSLTTFTVGSRFWHKLTAVLILVSLYSFSTDLRPRPPTFLGRYSNAFDPNGCFPPFSTRIFRVSV